MPKAKLGLSGDAQVHDESWSKFGVYSEDLIIPQGHAFSYKYRRLSLDPGLAFGVVLRAVRKKVGLTQEQLALAAGVDRSYVSMVERGVNQPSVRMLFKFAAVLGLTPTELIALTEERAATD